MKISGVYKITNTATGDFYIGSSKNVNQRWACHKCLSTWNKHPKNPMYLDMKRYGLDKFDFEILAEVESGSLKEKEQQFIETLKPTYNDRNANSWNIERKKEYMIEYNQQNRKKYKEYMIEYNQQNRKKHKEYQIEYYQQNREKRKEYQIEYYQQNREKRKEYQNQLCYYNGETLTLNALSARFQRAGIEKPTSEAKKYLLKKESNNAIEFYDIFP